MTSLSLALLVVASTCGRVMEKGEGLSSRSYRPLSSNRASTPQLGDCKTAISSYYYDHDRGSSDFAERNSIFMKTALAEIVSLLS